MSFYFFFLLSLKYDLKSEISEVFFSIFYVK